MTPTNRDKSNNYLLLLPKPEERRLEERPPLPKPLPELRRTELEFPEGVRVLLPKPEPEARPLVVVRLALPDDAFLMLPVVRKVVRFLTAAGGSL